MQIFKGSAMIESMLIFSFWASVVTTMTEWPNNHKQASLTIKQEQQDLLFTSPVAIFTSLSSLSVKGNCANGKLDP